MYNGDFSKWSKGGVFTVGNGVGQQVADGWYVGPGLGGGVISLTSRPALIGEVGLPFDCRTILKMGWLHPFTYPTSWMTFIEWGEGHGVPRGLGVREHQGATIAPSIYARCFNGTCALRQTVWQSLGVGPSGSPDPEELYGTAVNVNSTWQKISDTFTLPTIGGLALRNTSDPSGLVYCNDYTGYGLDILNDGGCHYLEFAMAEGM